MQINGNTLRFNPAVLETRLSSKMPQALAGFTSEDSAEMDDRPDRSFQMYALAERLTHGAATALEQTPDLA